MVMIIETQRVRVPISLILSCFLLITHAISSGTPHHHSGAASSKFQRRQGSGALSATYSAKGTTYVSLPSFGLIHFAWNCAFTKWPQPSGFGAVAVASNQWNSSQNCGACLEVTGPGGVFKAIISNQCPSCEANGLDLDDDIWNQVSGNKPKGIIQIQWKIVSCGFSKPILFMNKSGVSQYWNSIQVQGSNTPVKSLEISTNGGSSWTLLERQSNSNYFQPKDGKGLGTTGDIRVTCLSGKQFISKNIDLATAESPKPGGAISKALRSMIPRKTTRIEFSHFVPLNPSPFRRFPH
ncbi:hypothetical protein PSHT_04026 [Puccinia striiformis]|uniref:Expansin-like EG45 domain-containing protein n=1 Tax=Puccinia striiformis TaxID=27350 RepID=A0A2S4WDS8_9BASI|nr:hypothetical protein PSHT_04026 [Puccinia striiformis]